MLDQLGDVVRQEIHRGDEEVPAAHGRVQDLEVQDSHRRIKLLKLNAPFLFGSAVAFERGSFSCKNIESLVGQRLQGPLDDQINQFLRGIETAAVFAGIRIEANGKVAVVAHRLALQQPLVDRAKLLHGHVAVVDKVAVGVAQVVDDGRDGRVGQTHRFQQRRGVGREQPAVVRRQTNGLVAPADELEQRRQVVVIVGGHGRVRVVSRHPVRNVVADGLSQTIVVVARIVDWQQAPVLGVEHKQQAVEEDQGRIPALGEALA